MKLATTKLSELTSLHEKNLDDEEECDIVIVNPCYGVRFYPVK